MKLSMLQKLFRNEINISKFKNKIQIEVEQYSKKLRTKGISVPINVDEDCALYFSKNDLLYLCKYYLDNSLIDADIYYIADCLTLSECVSFENNELYELIEQMTDSEINGAITKERILSIINTLE